MAKVKVKLNPKFEYGEMIGGKSATIAHGLGQLPWDLPVFMEVHRLVGDKPAPDSSSPELKGWVMESHINIFDVDVAIRIDRPLKGNPARLRIFLREGEGEYENVGEWEK